MPQAPSYAGTAAAAGSAAGPGWATGFAPAAPGWSPFGAGSAGPAAPQLVPPRLPLRVAPLAPRDYYPRTAVAGGLSRLL
eukprot:14635536-Alexandrium_andersonii.AAC.1